MTFNNNFFSIILIGGKGSRFSKIYEPPKQLIKLNKKSLLENQLIFFIRNGIKNFIFPLGYKKKYFVNFFKKKKLIINYKLKIHLNKIRNKENDKVNILLIDSGKNSSKLKRIKDSIKHIDNEEFLVTYGDGLADINLKNYLKIYKKNKKAIIACKNINSQFGHLKLQGNNIISFKEKPLMEEPINIGYYFFSKTLFNKYFKKNYELEDKFIKSLIRNKKIVAFKHKGFFFNIDRKKDLDNIKKNYKKIIKNL